MKSEKIVFLLLFSGALKVLLAAFFPVFADEAYYYIWSLHPQLSYFDHPPMVSWLISLGHLILPSGQALSLRFSFLLLSFLTPLIWIKILRVKQFDDSQIFVFLCLLLLNPLLGPGSILATPDVPLVFFWSLSYLAFLKLDETHSLRWYALLGTFLGLGFCSKYHIVLFVLSGLLYLLISRKIMQLRPTGVLLTILLGGVFSSPVVIWNAQHEWSSFLFQINHGFGESGFTWAWPASYLVAQLVIINPIVVIALFKKSGQGIERIFSMSQLAFFFSSSFKSVVEGNWPLTSHLHSITNFTARLSKNSFRYALIYWLIIYVLIIGFMLSPASHAVRKNLINSSQMTPLYDVVAKYEPLYGPSYQVSSLLTWKTGINIPKLGELSRLDFYDSLSESSPVAHDFYALKYDYSAWPDRYNHYKKTRLQVFDNTGIELYQFSYE